MREPWSPGHSATRARRSDTSSLDMKISDPIGKVYQHSMFKKKTYNIPKGTHLILSGISHCNLIGLCVDSTRNSH